MDELLKSVIVGAVAGTFSAGVVWGVLKTELRFLRRDVDEIRRRCLGITQEGACNG